jgi:hypothetical protein
VLVAGGLNQSSATASAELYDPATGLWTAAASLNAARYGHTATLLGNGKVLVAGGTGGGSPVPSAELYDPASGTWSAAGPLNTARVAHTTTLLPDGTVLAVGGYDSEALSSVELYNPTNNKWVMTNGLNTARDSHTATLLPNGELLIAGGTFPNQSGNVPVAGAEIYSATNGMWTTNGVLNIGRFNHTATLLSGGRVLIAGGFGADSALSSAEIFVLSPPPPVFQSITQNGHDITFTWSAAIGSSYQAQYKTDLISINWTNLGSAVTATNSVMSGTDTVSPGMSAKFYRIALLP